MKKHLAIFLIALSAFQAIHCQETEVQTEEEPVEEWITLDAKAFYNDELNRTIADFGAQLFIATLLGDNQIARDTWMVKSLNNAQYGVDPEFGYQYFKFNYTVSDLKTHDIFLADCDIQYSTDLTIRSKVLKYTTYVAADVKDQNGNTVTGWKETTNYFGDDNSNVQFVLPGTFEPTGESTVVDNWEPMQDEDFQADQTLQDEGQKAADYCVRQAVGQLYLPEGDWKATVYYVATQPSFAGTFYYRFTIDIRDTTNKLQAGAVVYEDRDAETKDFTWTGCGINLYQEYLD